MSNKRQVYFTLLISILLVKGCQTKELCSGHTAVVVTAEKTYQPNWPATFLDQQNALESQLLATKGALPFYWQCILQPGEIELPPSTANNPRALAMRQWLASPEVTEVYEAYGQMLKRRPHPLRTWLELHLDTIWGKPDERQQLLNTLRDQYISNQSSPLQHKARAISLLMERYPCYAHRFYTDSLPLLAARHSPVADYDVSTLRALLYNVPGTAVRRDAVLRLYEEHSRNSK